MKVSVVGGITPRSEEFYPFFGVVGVGGGLLPPSSVLLP